MRQQLCIAAALVLSACTAPSSMVDGGSFTRPQASPASCAAQGQQFDEDSNACFTPSASATLPRVAQRRLRAAAALPAPSANDDTIDVPIEPDAVIKKDLRGKAKLLSELVGFVLENGYACDSISGLRAYVASRRFQLVCNQFRDTYEIEAQGRHWIVTAK